MFLVLWLCKAANYDSGFCHSASCPMRKWAGDHRMLHSWRWRSCGSCAFCCVPFLCCCRLNGFKPRWPLHVAIQACRSGVVVTGWTLLLDPSHLTLELCSPVQWSGLSLPLPGQVMLLSWCMLDHYAFFALREVFADGAGLLFGDGFLRCSGFLFSVSIIPKKHCSLQGRGRWA